MLLRELIQTYGDPDLQSILGDPIRELELTFYAKLKSKPNGAAQQAAHDIALLFVAGRYAVYR